MQYLDHYGDHEYNGYAVRQWLAENTDICVYIAGAYLAFVFKGPALVEYVFGGNPPVKITKKLWVVWNALLSIFSLYGWIRVGPRLIRDFQHYGLRDTLCTFREEEFYTTKLGFALGLFAISKLPEFGDTFFLILGGKKTLPFLSWFHHVTTYLFAWYSYQQGTSIFICAAAMNYFVHTIMYCYFAMAEAGYKSLVKPFAMYITMLQIAQMIGGLFVTGYVLYQKWMGSACDGTSLSAARTQLVIYIFNFYLFSEMFVKAYLLPKPARSNAAPAAAAGADSRKKSA